LNGVRLARKPLFVVVTKVDVCSEAVMKELIHTIEILFKRLCKQYALADLEGQFALSFGLYTTLLLPIFDGEWHTG